MTKLILCYKGTLLRLIIIFNLLQIEFFAVIIVATQKIIFR